MKVIYKYILKVQDIQDLFLPIESKILSVEEQNNEIVLYALVDSGAESIERYSIIIHGTGHPADDIVDYNFLGTVKLFNGIGVFHVFYK